MEQKQTRRRVTPLKVTHLPADVLMCICDQFKELQDINSLARCCRHTYECLDQYLYRRAQHLVVQLAAKAGMDNTLKKALSYGLDVNRTTPIGNLTPLSLAIIGRHLSTVMILLAVDGIEMNCEDSAQWWTPIQWATSHGEAGMVELLLKHGGSDRERLNAAMLLAVRNDDADIFKILLHYDGGMDLNAKDVTGDTALTLATKNKNVDLQKILIENEQVDLNCRASFKEQDTAGMTPLMITVKHDDHLVTVRYLLSQKDRLDLKSTDHRGNTALHFAALEGDLPVCSLLLEADCTLLSCRNGEGNTPLFLAVQRMNVALCKLFLSQNDIDLLAVNQTGNTLLLEAAKVGSLELLTLFLQESGESELSRRNVEGNTPLLLSAINQHYRVLEFLIEKGMDPNCKNTEGLTALIAAARSASKTECLELLLATGRVNVNAQTHSGSTALMCASWQANVSAVKILLGVRGIHIDLRDDHGWTALAWARPIYTRREPGHKDVEKVLIKHGANKNPFGFSFMERLNGRTMWLTHNSRRSFVP